MEKRLTSKELMIGDTVLYCTDMMQDTWEVMIIKNGGDIDFACNECYKDIPLTEEILLKNGFEKEVKKYDEEHVYVSFAIPELLGFNIFHCESLDVWLFEDHILSHIRSVRDLQRFLQLAEIDLNIKI